MKRREFLRQAISVPVANLAIAAKPIVALVGLPSLVADAKYEPLRHPVIVECPETKKKTAIGWSSGTSFFWSVSKQKTTRLIPISKGSWTIGSGLDFWAEYESGGEPEIKAPYGSLVVLQGYFLGGMPFVVRRTVSIKPKTPEGVSINSPWSLKTKSTHVTSNSQKANRGILGRYVRPINCNEVGPRGES